MVVEGVSFNERLIREMKKGGFIEEMLPHFFTDRALKERRRVLSEIYDRIINKQRKEGQ